MKSLSKQAVFSTAIIFGMIHPAIAQDSAGSVPLLDEMIVYCSYLELKILGNTATAAQKTLLASKCKKPIQVAVSGKAQSVTVSSEIGKRIMEYDRAISMDTFALPKKSVAVKAAGCSILLLMNAKNVGDQKVVEPLLTNECNTAGAFVKEVQAKIQNDIAAVAAPRKALASSTSPLEAENNFRAAFYQYIKNSCYYAFEFRTVTNSVTNSPESTWEVTGLNANPVTCKSTTVDIVEALDVLKMANQLDHVQVEMDGLLNDSQCEDMARDDVRNLLNKRQYKYQPTDEVGRFDKFYLDVLCPELTQSFGARLND